MMGRKQKLSGEESDAVTGWRKLICWRPGERSRIKRKLNKRQRKAARAEEFSDFIAVPPFYFPNNVRFRCHLTNSQRANELLQTNRQYVHDAKRIATNAPELLEQVRAGELSVHRQSTNWRLILPLRRAA